MAVTGGGKETDGRGEVEVVKCAWTGFHRGGCLRGADWREIAVNTTRMNKENRFVQQVEMDIPTCTHEYYILPPSLALSFSGLSVLSHLSSQNQQTQSTARFVIVPNSVSPAPNQRRAHQNLLNRKGKGKTYPTHRQLTPYTGMCSSQHRVRCISCRPVQ